jgi:2-polyprenyl-3-methyl-5-hydroxy-6-metoxy-1,4-benzoquinol methylase
VHSCKACQCVLEDPELESYCVCASCNSANYISSRKADAENNSYFDSVYSGCTRKVIEERRKHFVGFERIYSLFHKQEPRRFQEILARISQAICSADTSVEVGFGYGHELIQFLKQGANIYGIDLSEEAVSSFRSRYPEHSGRVFGISGMDSKVNAIYSNALFEHLDEPGDFLRRAFGMLKPDGKLLMRLPLITSERYTKSQISFDINFWKPCHRVLYTLKGLKTLLGAHGFRIIESATYAYYGYKVMSTMLKHGYRDVEIVRDPCLPIKHLDSDWTYQKMLVKGLFMRVVCSEFAMIATKVRGAD